MTNYSNCDEIAEMLDAYHDHELTGAERSAVESHLNECAGCSSKLANIARLVLDLRAMPRLMPPRDIVGSMDFDKLEAPVSFSAEPEAPKSNVVDGAERFKTGFSTSNAANDVSATNNVTPRRSRLFAGITAGAVAAAALIFGVALHKPANDKIAVSPTRDNVANRNRIASRDNLASPTESIKDTQVAITPDSATDPNFVAGTGALKSVNQVDPASANSSHERSEVQPRAVASRPNTNVPARDLIASSMSASNNTQVATTDVVSSNVPETMELTRTSVEIAALTDGDDMTDSLGVATDEDGLYEIKI